MCQRKRAYSYAWKWLGIDNMSAVIRKCSVSEIENAPNYAELLEAYAKEMVVDGAPLFQARIEMYRHLESLGALQCFGAYMQEKLVGFITVLISVLPHVSAVMAVTESFFVLIDYRTTGAGNALRRAAEEYAASATAFGIFISAPVGGILAQVLSKLDEYTETNRVFYRKLSNV